MIKIKTNHFNKNDYENLKNQKKDFIKETKEQLINKTIVGKEWTGWLNWVGSDELRSEILKIYQYKNEWKQQHINTVVVVGIGGSIIATKAIIEMCQQDFSDDGIKLIYVDSISAKFSSNLLKHLETKNWAMIVISKSGTTFETIVNFRLLREQLFKQYQQAWTSRTVMITNDEKGTLREIANSYHLKTLTIPNDIGGRFSAITAVSLFPCALVNINVIKLLEGYKKYLDDFISNDITDNQAVEYALIRYLMKNIYHKDVEVFCTYEKDMVCFGNYYKQIFAESEGKVENVLIPTLADYSNDLHAIGQLYQEGPKNFFETTIICNDLNEKIKVPPSSFNDDDGIKYLEHKQLLSLNHCLMDAVISAHNHVPNVLIELSFNDEFNAGQLLAFFAIAATFSARLNNLNPFDQNGVEFYKNNLKSLLKKDKE